MNLLDVAPIHKQALEYCEALHSDAYDGIFPTARRRRSGGGRKRYGKVWTVVTLVEVDVVVTVVV